MNISQKKVFLNGEGNNWFNRNYRTFQNWETKVDPVLESVPFDELGLNSQSKILEIGCGQGFRLKKLQDYYHCSVVGLDPSSDSIKFAEQNLGLSAVVGTADDLPFEDNSFDVVIYGFCLYLCDRNDLFKIAAESHRVLKNKSWIIINDFWSSDEYSNKYVHKEGIHSFKTDYSKMFIWHPSCCIYKHILYHHSDFKFTDIENEHVCITLIRVSS